MGETAIGRQWEKTHHGQVEIPSAGKIRFAASDRSMRGCARPEHRSDPHDAAEAPARTARAMDIAKPPAPEARAQRPASTATRTSRSRSQTRQPHAPPHHRPLTSAPDLLSLHRWNPS